jgi:glutamate-1-semialdehyde 2,1-aminomutase
MHQAPPTAYQAQTPRSRAALTAARRRLPTGLSRQTLVYEPYPFVARRGAGAYLEDVDGGRYLDFVNNYTSLLHGHNHGPSTAAAHAAMLDSAAPGAPTELELALSDELARRVPSQEWIRFAVTGTEAVLFALRAARAHTGRARIVKFEGGFHGSLDDVQVSLASPPMAAGDFSEGAPAGAGATPRGTLVCVYNDRESVSRAFAAHGPEIAAVIVEPFLGNAALIPAEREFLGHVAAIAREHGALLILDEIQSCRLAHGAAQSLYGIAPDLTTMGKTIGGGMPLASVGGRREVMEVFDGHRPAIRQTGTFNAFPASLAAGLATLAAWPPDEVERLNARGELVRAALRESLARHGVRGHVNGQGSMFNLSLGAPVTGYRSFTQTDAARLEILHLELLSRGVYIAARGTGCLSTPMTDEDLAFFCEAADAAIASLPD